MNVLEESQINNMTLANKGKKKVDIWEEKTISVKYKKRHIVDVPNYR